MPAQRSPEQVEREAEANRRALLAAEVATLLLLRRRRDEVLEFGVRRGYSLPRIAAGLSGGLWPAIAAARANTRGIGLARLGFEIDTIGVPSGTIASSPIDAARDVVRAKAASVSFAQRWLRKAEAETVSRAAKAATDTTAKSLERIAVAENADAFGSGRGTAARRLPALGLLRVWDAQLDKLTCPICSRMDGTIVGIRERFSVGEPGTVHPYCRCVDQILSTSEDERGTLIQPARLQRVSTTVVEFRPPARTAKRR